MRAPSQSSPSAVRLRASLSSTASPDPPPPPPPLTIPLRVQVVLKRAIGLKKDEYFIDRKSATKNEVSVLARPRHLPLHSRRRRARRSEAAACVLLPRGRS